jgi:hypothetical protein
MIRLKLFMASLVLNPECNRNLANNLSMSVSKGTVEQYHAITSELLAFSILRKALRESGSVCFNVKAL